MRNLTLEELGEKINLTRQRVCMLEYGRLKPDNARKCAEALDVNIFTILGEDALAVIPETQEDKKALIRTINEINIKKDEQETGSTKFVLKVTKMTDYELKDYHDELFKKTLTMREKMRLDSISKEDRKELCDEMLMAMLGMKLAIEEAFNRLMNN